VRTHRGPKHSTKLASAPGRAPQDTHMADGSTAICASPEGSPGNRQLFRGWDPTLHDTSAPTVRTFLGASTVVWEETPTAHHRDDRLTHTQDPPAARHEHRARRRGARGAA